MTNLQLLSLLSKPHRDGFLTGGNMLGNDDDDIMIIMMMISSLAIFFEISEIS